MHPSRVGALVGAGLVLLGVILMAVSSAEYLGSPQALDSSSGNVVFSVNGQLVQYPEWTPDPLTVLLLGAGLVVVASSLVLAAVTWRPRPARVY